MEGHVGGGADLINGSFGVELGLTGLPGEAHDDAVLVVVHIHLAVGDVQPHQPLLDDAFGGVQLLIGGVGAVRNHEGHVHAALDVNAEANVAGTFHIGHGAIVGLAAQAEQGQIRKHQNQNGRQEKLPGFCSSFHSFREPPDPAAA